MKAEASTFPSRAQITGQGAGPPIRLRTIMYSHSGDGHRTGALGVALCPHGGGTGDHCPTRETHLGPVCPGYR